MSRESAVIVPVPAAEPVVASWRARFDASAAAGMPAHVTALYPFLPAERLTDEVVGALRELCAGLPVLDVVFARTARFDDSAVVYLEPEPADGLLALTMAIVGRWPEAPPFRGAFAEVIPHLTVAQVEDVALLDEAEAGVAAGLPVRARLPFASLYVLDGGMWRERVRLPFGGGVAR